MISSEVACDDCRLLSLEDMVWTDSQVYVGERISQEGAWKGAQHHSC